MAKIIVLSAGRGSRMGKLTAICPKGFVSINHQRIFDLQRKAIFGAGFSSNDIIYISGYKSENFNKSGWNNLINSKWESTNSLYSLKLGTEILSKENCIVIYSDVLFSKEAIDLLRESFNIKSQITLLSYSNWLNLWKLRMKDPLQDVENFQINKNGYLDNIGGRPRSLESVQGQYMGMFTMTPTTWELSLSILNAMPISQIESLDITSFLALVCKAQLYPIKTINYNHDWFEVDNESDLNLLKLINPSLFF